MMPWLMKNLIWMMILINRGDKAAPNNGAMTSLRGRILAAVSR